MLGPAKLRKVKDRMNSAVKSTRAACVLALVACLAGNPGCNTGGREGLSNIKGLNQSATPLPVDHDFYVGAKMETARFSHQTVTNQDGFVVAIGGTDERHLTSLDTAEIFDQSSVVDDPPLPESGSGAWFSTDFSGEPMAMKNGGRIFHTATLIADNNILVCGGTPDVLLGEAVPASEIFEGQTRTFDPEGLKIQKEMELPRFRHTAVTMANGNILMVGGQLSVDETIIDPNFPPGSIFFMIDLEVFPSTKTIEIFNPAERKFNFAEDATGQESELSTPRGRFGHASVEIAGEDNQLGTNDDLVLTGAGFQTLSGQFAPQTKFPAQITDPVSDLEFFDLTNGFNSSAAALTLAPRTNGGIALNLGEIVDTTPDGEPGVSNIAMWLHGDDDALGATSLYDSVQFSEIVAATFSGFGPAGGVSFTPVTAFGHQMNAEVLLITPPPNCTCAGNIMGRTHGTAMMMQAPRFYDRDAASDVPYFSNWAVSMGGVHLADCSPTQFATLEGICTNEVRGVSFFDPFWNLNNIVIPLPPWDLTTERTFQNPTGVVGTWILGHPALGIPDGDTYDAYGEALLNLVQLNEPRIFHAMNIVGGEGGLLGDLDDRILISGGGSSFFPEYGGETISVSTEIYLPPNSNDHVPKN